MCVTCVYAFAALSKLNPTWLAGTDLLNMAATSPQAAFLPNARLTSMTPLIPAIVVAVEGWLAVGLWVA